MTIREAKRQAIPLLISIAGTSGSGKTYSALSIAAGLANGGKVGFLDSEAGRGAMYSDDADLMAGMPEEKYFISDITEPFTPAKYAQKIKEFINFGCKVLVIDSASHAWDGSGGCQDIAENNKRGGMPNWALAKMEHKKLMNLLTQCPMHIIICLRAREKTKPMKNDQGKIEMIECGLQPIQEKNFMYEMTVSMMMNSENPGKPTITKCPKPLLHLFAGEQTLVTKSIGEKLHDWSIGGENFDAELRNLKRELREAASFGAEALQSRHIKEKEGNGELLKKVWTPDFAEEVKGLAKEADELAGQQAEQNEEAMESKKLTLIDTN